MVKVSKIWYGGGISSTNGGGIKYQCMVDGIKYQCMAEGGGINGRIKISMDQWISINGYQWVLMAYQLQIHCIDGYQGIRAQQRYVSSINGFTDERYQGINGAEELMVSMVSRHGIKVEVMNGINGIKAWYQGGGIKAWHSINGIKAKVEISKVSSMVHPMNQGINGIKYQWYSGQVIKVSMVQV